MNATKERERVWTVDGAPLRRGAMVETIEGGLGHYVGRDGAGDHVICFRASRWQEACRRFDRVERGRGDDR